MEEKLWNIFEELINTAMSLDNSGLHIQHKKDITNEQLKTLSFKTFFWHDMLMNIDYTLKNEDKYLFNDISVFRKFLTLIYSSDEGLFSFKSLDKRMDNVNKLFKKEDLPYICLLDDNKLTLGKIKL